MSIGKLERERARLTTRAKAFFDASVEVGYAMKTNSDPVEALTRLSRINEQRVQDVDAELKRERDKRKAAAA